MEWISVEDQLPQSGKADGSDNEYYLIYVLGYGKTFAMYLDDEWWSSYQSKIARKVTHWFEVHKPKL